MAARSPSSGVRANSRDRCRPGSDRLLSVSRGEVAVVIRQNRVRRLQPRVLVICGPDKVPASTFRVMELLYQPDHDTGRVHITRGLPAGAYGLDANEYYLS